MGVVENMVSANRRPSHVSSVSQCIDGPPLTRT
jgi:hypothetical protein